MRTTYRDFEIRYEPLLGQFLYAHENWCPENLNQYEICDTEKECKDAIDKWYLDNTTYKVVYSESRPPKFFEKYSEAERFCKCFKLSLDSITILLCGDVFEFDAP